MSLTISELIRRLESIKSSEGDLHLHTVAITKVSFIEYGEKKVPRYAELKLNRMVIQKSS